MSTILITAKSVPKKDCKKNIDRKANRSTDHQERFPEAHFVEKLRIEVDIGEEI
jgi:hypothetical protein